MLKKKCLECNIKIKSLLPRKCKCGNIYCGLHIVPTLHNCQFDYITLNKENLIKKNPKIIGEKIKKID